MARHPRIETNPEVMFGKPALKGTRLTVEQILRELGAGVTPEEIVEQHPRLELDDIHAAESFAADYMADEDIVTG